MTLDNGKQLVVDRSKAIKEAVSKFVTLKLEYVVAALVCVFVFLVSFSSAFESLENKYYDTYLKLKPEIAQTPELLMLCIDDKAIEEIGTYPWSRDIVADMLIRMRELGAKTIVFDIEFLNPSSLGINPVYVQEQLPKEYSAVKNEVIGSVADFSGAIGANAVPPEAAIELGDEITGYLDPLLDDLYDSISSNIFRDNDMYFAKTLKFFGGSVVTINSAAVNTLDDAQPAIDYAYNNMLVSDIEDPNGYIKKNNTAERLKQNRTYGIGPALLPLLQSARTGGFPNVVVDDDGIRRRFELFSEYNGKYVPQLVFAPILKIMQPEKIVRKHYSVELINALPLDGSSTERRTISIPLDGKGCVLTHWVKTDFPDSFKSDSAFFLYDIDQIEKTLLNHINAIARLELRTSRGYLSYHDMAEYLITEYAELDTVKQQLLNEQSDDFDGYFERRATFFTDMATLIEGGFDSEIYALFDSVREASGDDTLYRDVQQSIENTFTVFASDYKLYNENYNRLKEKYNGSFCIIGNNAVGTTDFGATPFNGYYPNVGTHGNLYNTIAIGDYIKPMPKSVSVLIMAICCLLFSLLFRRLQTLNSRFLAGVVFLALVMVILYAVFAAFLIYIESFSIVVSIVLMFIIVTVSRFLLAEKDKNFLRKAFSTYLSGDIIDEIINDPTKLKLGGQEKELTAIFTDVRQFSTLSEKVTPTQLVSILNKYLSRMSDIVLEYKGTIDKFEGDAIIAFYGAPVDNPEHARMALTSAIRMKQAEVELNKVLVESGEAPNELLTRIGINSGPMVVGNMGTDAKMNYTIMGNDVNLAARLEGVNKVYGTWILASESSYNKAGPGFLARRLDRVRVVGINTPVQLYNIMGFLDETDQKTIDGVGLFHNALDLYLNREFEKSIRHFEHVLEVLPEDPPSLVYLDRARKLIKDGVPDDWDGVVNMTSK